MLDVGTRIGKDGFGAGVALWFRAALLGLQGRQAVDLFRIEHHGMKSAWAFQLNSHHLGLAVFVADRAALLILGLLFLPELPIDDFVPFDPLRTCAPASAAWL